MNEKDCKGCAFLGMEGINEGKEGHYCYIYETMPDECKQFKENMIDDKINELIRTGAEHNLVLFAILFRRAGVAIQWHDQNRVEPDAPNWKEGLTVHKYYDSLDAAADAEIKRLNG